ncbi:MAG: hypothetical protein BGO01_08245 [Armatimonadetes bacterium 55-13]|nr:redoxin domain-containing protein [Armatimonadota bacterium]OJU62462.1 MAG: hypothetical protein BGO01_08245 [Armatimonadetes bacterium 55-13]
MMIALISLLLGLQAQANGPSLVAYDLKGKPVAPLVADGQSKATVLIFYIAHCPIGQKMTPEINRVFREFKPKGMRMYMVHEEMTMPPADLAKEAREYGLMPPILIDREHRLMSHCGARISPQVFVYDARMKLQYHGRINDFFYGLGQMRSKVTHHDLRDAIAAVVQGLAPKVAKTEAVGCVLPTD